MVPSDWEQSFIVCLYKGKGDALERGNYRGLKLTEQVMKVLERIVDSLIRHSVCWCQSMIPSLALSQAEAQQMQSLLTGSSKRSIYCQQTLHGFRRPGEGIWSSTSEGHLVGAEKTWCGGVDCVTGAGDVCKCTEPCPCWWGVQWKVWSKGRCSPGLSTQPVVIVLEALSHEFCSGVPWEDLYADDLVIIADLLEECVRRLLTWKEAMEEKELRVNAGKTKIMICGMGLDLLQSSGEFTSAICRNGVGSNSIFCNGCKLWVHKKCSGIKRLTKDPDYRYTWCQGTASHKRNSKSDLTSWRW